MSAKYFGFRVKLVDGRVLEESDILTWDDVPTDVGISALACVNMETGNVVFSMTMDDKYYFMNEAVGVAGEAGLHSGKIFGAVKDETAYEVKLDLLDGAKITDKILLPAQLNYHPRVYRNGR
jgi:hypothetical protein